jgi:hypothetical protein
MLLVANAMRFGQGEGAFVDAGMSRLIYRGCWAGRDCTSRGALAFDPAGRPAPE